MHELSIVSSLIELCEENAKANGANKITQVEVKIGRLSGVETPLFERCFESFKESSELCKNALLVCEVADIVILCKNCEKESILAQNVFKCPHCESVEFQITQGEDLHLMRLVME